MQLQAVPNTTREHLANLRPISWFLPTAFHPALLMDDATLNDAIADCLPNNILGILLRVQMQLDAYVA
jgi:hypothetical protein